MMIGDPAAFRSMSIAAAKHNRNMRSAGNTADRIMSDLLNQGSTGENNA